jgi:hypothetical protein
VFCSQIEMALKKQNEVNVTFHNRIGKLEVITQSIDDKVDHLLDLFEEKSSRKAPRTTESKSCDGVGIPNHYHLNQSQGVSET